MLDNCPEYLTSLSNSLSSDEASFVEDVAYLYLIQAVNPLHFSQYGIYLRLVSRLLVIGHKPLMTDVLVGLTNLLKALAQFLVSISPFHTFLPYAHAIHKCLDGIEGYILHPALVDVRLHGEAQRLPNHL